MYEDAKGEWVELADKTAFLSSEKGYTVFRFDNHVIRFKAPYSLEKYSEIKKWDHGYLIVKAKYKHNKEEEEEYIDLEPILNNLYFDADKVLDSMKKVKMSMINIKKF